MSTSALRDLHKAYPNEYLTDIRVPTGCEQIFFNNPYVTHIDNEDNDAKYIKLNYEEIHRSGMSGLPFASAHTIDLGKAIGRPIPSTTLRPDIFLSQDEIGWPSPVVVKHGYQERYWIINAGVKNDYTLKYYPYYQEVVDGLAGKITFVQVGQIEHNHPALKNVIDMRGQTDLRELFRLSYHADGALNAVSLQMVIMMALDKPCVVISGAREGVRWQLCGSHRFLYVNGAMKCAPGGDGCWKSKKADCVNLVEGEPLCMKLITPELVISSILMYYEGGRLTWPN